MSAKKKQILTAAKKLISREGSSGFSMRKVAGECGMSLGNLQYHYPGKAMLIDAVLQELFDEYLLVYQDHFSLDVFSQEALEQLISRLLHSSYSKDETALFRALFSFPDKDIDQAIKQFYLRLYEQTRRGLAQLSGQDLDSPGVKQAAAILYPYVDGYELVSRFIDMDIEMISTDLGKLLFPILST